MDIEKQLSPRRLFSLKGMIDFMTSYYSLLFTLITLASASFLTLVLHKGFLESFLLSVLIVNIGIRGVVAFTANWFPIFSGDIAELYGWERQNTYQREIVAADAAFAILGIAAYWVRGDFWTATIIGASICWILSEYANIASILHGRKNPDKKIDPHYEVSPEIFRGMKIDVVMVIVTLVILAMWKGLIF